MDKNDDQRFWYIYGIPYWFLLLIMMGILVEVAEVVWNPLGWDALFVLDFETFVLECEGIEESS